MRLGGRWESIQVWACPRHSPREECTTRTYTCSASLPHKKTSRRYASSRYTAIAKTTHMPAITLGPREPSNVWPAMYDPLPATYAPDQEATPYNISSLSPTFKQIKLETSPPAQVPAPYLPPDLAWSPALASAHTQAARWQPQPQTQPQTQQQVSHPQVHPAPPARLAQHRFPSSGHQLQIDSTSRIHPSASSHPCSHSHSHSISHPQPHAHPHPQPQPAAKHRRSHARSFSTTALSHSGPLPLSAQPVQRASATSTKLTGSRFEPRSPCGTRQCTNCGETSTPQWRGQLCNACALWKRARGQDRPVPLKFGGKKVLPPGSRERVKKTATAPPPVFGAVRSSQQFVQAAAAAAAAGTQGAFSGAEGMAPFTFAGGVKGEAVGTATMPEVSCGSCSVPLQASARAEQQHRHFDLFKRAMAFDDSTQGPIRLPPIGPLLAACPIEPVKMPQSRSNSVDHTSLLRFSLSPEPATGDADDRITLPYPIPSTMSRRPSMNHSRAASESWGEPTALPSIFAGRSERDVFMQPLGSSRVQGHMRHASDSLSALMVRRDSLQGI